jgi:hypothetical protein
MIAQVSTGVKDEAGRWIAHTLDRSPDYPMPEVNDMLLGSDQDSSQDDGYG